MADAYGIQDALVLYLTGASSNGQEQRDPDLSLGGYRSSVEARTLIGIVNTPIIEPLVFLRYSDANGEGTATIRAVDTGTIYYTAPGDTEGAGVAIASGESKVVYSNDTDKWVRIYCDRAVEVNRTSTITLYRAFNNIVGMANVPDADRTAGATTYRAGILFAHGTFGVLEIKIWLDDAASQAGYEIAIEPLVGNQIQTIADETTAPTGLSFSAPATEGAGLSIPVLDRAAGYGLWIKRVFPALGTVALSEYSILHISYKGAAIDGPIFNTLVDTSANTFDDVWGNTLVVRA